MDKVWSYITDSHNQLLYQIFIKGTYDKTSKFDLSIEGWGGEDVRFYETCVKYKVKHSHNVSALYHQAILLVSLTSFIPREAIQAARSD